VRYLQTGDSGDLLQGCSELNQVKNQLSLLSQTSLNPAPLCISNVQLLHKNTFQVLNLVKIEGLELGGMVDHGSESWLSKSAQFWMLR